METQYCDYRIDGYALIACEHKSQFEIRLSIRSQGPSEARRDDTSRVLAAHPCLLMFVVACT